MIFPKAVSEFTEFLTGFITEIDGGQKNQRKTGAASCSEKPRLFVVLACPCYTIGEVTKAYTRAGQQERGSDDEDKRRGRRQLCAVG
jgi:hypothetical protein